MLVYTRYMSIILALFFFAFQSIAQTSTTQQDSCVACHSAKEWRVTHKKLFDYFQTWNGSTHESEGVTCVDCHGGDSSKTDMRASHGAGMGTETKESLVNFRKIPETCGNCHEPLYDAYRKSKHFKNLEGTDKNEDGSDKQGPNCITCHGSMNANRPKVKAVRAVCEQCHTSSDDPDVPASAEALLNDLNAIRRYRNYIQRRGSAEQVSKIFRQQEPMLDKINESWHQFDLELIDQHTRKLLEKAKQARDEIRRQRKQKPK